VTPALLLAIPLVLAQIAPPGDQLPADTIKPKAASTGTTDLDESTFAAGNALQEENEQYATEGSVSLGGLFASGNARTIALTSAARLRLRRYENQITTAAAWNFARSTKTGESAAVTTVENYQGLGRYDLFLTPHVSLFLQSTVRRDRFQGLDFRLNVDPGIAYHFIQTTNQRLVVEVGYDLQYDIRRDEDRLATTPPIAKTRTLHDARAFLGYENKLYTEVSFVASLEYLQNFQTPELYRMIFDTGLKSTIRGRLAVAATYTMRYENLPLPGIVKADSLASVALVYTLF
jgi:putative salt-induced outer membrane protein YdiY